MKKYILLVSVLFLTVFNCQSQGFIEEENTWVYNGVDWVGQQMLQVEYKLEGDTLINGLIYKVLWENDESEDPNWYRAHLYYREDENKRVFRVEDNGNEYLVYDFSLELNEEATIYNSYTAKVVGINSVIGTDGQMIKQQKVTVEGVGCTTTLWWLDEIGGINGFLPELCENSNDTVFAIAGFYIDDDLQYPIVHSTLCSETVSSKDIIEQSIDIYPNPVSDEITVQFDPNGGEVKSVSIYSLQGVLLYNADSPKETMQIDVSQLPSSMYILQVRMESNRLISRKVVKM